MKYLLILLLTGCLVKKEETHIHPCVVVPPKASKIELTLINGEESNPKDWPTLLKITQGSATMTGTMIGPKTLQLAAKSVPDSKPWSFEAAGVKYNAICKRHPDFKSDPTADYALCLLDKVMDLPWYESISSESVKMGDDVLLTGMGCEKPDGLPHDWTLKTGFAKVIGLPIDDNDIIVEGGAALCFGDLSSSAFAKDSKGVYKIIGVESRTDLEKVSNISATYTPAAKEFYTKWATDNKTDICGISKDAKKCREDSPTPPGPQPDCPK